MTTSAPLRLGLDFDNTIVCYDQAIAKLAEELFDLPPDLPRSKLSLRNHLRASGRETEWTTFQGELYGPGMRHAQPSKGAIETMLSLAQQGHELIIISHRSRHPYAGPRHDLHGAARDWVEERLKTNGLFTENPSTVHFLETREEKVAKISGVGCQAFLDDLPEVLGAPGFPAHALGILFDPARTGNPPPRCRRISAWPELNGVLAALP